MGQSQESKLKARPDCEHLFLEKRSACPCGCSKSTLEVASSPLLAIVTMYRINIAPNLWLLSLTNPKIVETVWTEWSDECVLAPGCVLYAW
jgi:hypothetical protein